MTSLKKKKFISIIIVLYACLVQIKIHSNEIKYTKKYLNWS